ncbi:hypothetical protein Aperf_G00000059124 [Anoplocephala perfoliata]
MAEIAIFYHNLMEDVIEGVKEIFTQEGVDLDVVEQLRKLWSSKFADTHVTDPEPVAQPASHYAQRLHGSQYTSNPPAPITRLPIQPTTLSGIGNLRTLAPIARPNAPLPTISMATSTTAPTGLVIRSAMPAAPAGPSRPAIVLASALSSQTVAAGLQPRIGNSQASAFTSIAIRTPPNASGQTALIGQPALAGVNGIATLQGPNLQLLQLGQQAVMVPLQIRQSSPGAPNLLSAPQVQQQNFGRSQVDGTGDGESDFSDEDVEDVADSFSLDMPLLRAGESLAQSAAPHRLGQQQTPSVPPTPSQQPFSSLAGHVGPQTVGGFDDEDDDSDDGLVAATPGTFVPPIGSSMFTPNPSIPPTPILGSETIATPAIASTPGKRLGSFVGLTPEKRSRQSLREASDFDDGDADVESDPEDYDKRLDALTGRTSRRKQKTPISRGDRQAAENGDEHIPDHPPPLPSCSGGELEGTATKPEQGEDPDAEGEEVEEDDEPLNSGDDVSDEDADQIFQSDNLIVCQYERFSRSRSRWRFWLRDGIMKLRGREHVFQRLSLEADWMYTTTGQLQGF